MGSSWWVVHLRTTVSSERTLGDLDSVQPWIRVEAPSVSGPYSALVAETRKIAGPQISGGWDPPPAETDDGVPVADVNVAGPEPFGSQLGLTLVAESTVPTFVIGVWLLQRPRIGRLGAVSAIAYAYSFVFFTGTVVYAPADGTRNFERLGSALSPWMTIHGGVMVIAGVGFGYAVSRAGVLPRWTGMTLAVGVVLIPLSMGAPDIVVLIGVGIRDLAFAGMGAALLRARRTQARAEL
jgi:hypothetical protein